LYGGYIAFAYGRGGVSHKDVEDELEGDGEGDGEGTAVLRGAVMVKLGDSLSGVEPVCRERGIGQSEKTYAWGMITDTVKIEWK
jgi:hypothetical protein